MDLTDVYKVANTDRVLDLEKELQKELAELQNEIEENETTIGIGTRAVSSVPLPKDINHFRQERKQVIDRVIQVSEAQQLCPQADLMREELHNAEKLEYTARSMPLLLHQYFLDRIQQLVQCKQMHMLRWKRFCEHTNTIEALYPFYQKRLTQIMTEYHDCTQRAQRLSAAREALLCKTDNAANFVKQDDLMIYLRWLVCHLHSVKRFNQYLRVLQWLPVSHKSDIKPPDRTSPDQEESSHAMKISSRYHDDVSLFAHTVSGTSRPGSAASFKSSSPVPHPPPVNPALLTTSPLPTSAMLLAAAASGGGIASDEASLGLPVNMMEFDELKPQITFLMNVYGISFNLDQVSTTADEMEMYAAVNRKFKTIFYRQEHMKTFKTYDKIEAAQDSWGSDASSHALKKEANWLEFVNLRPEKDPHQEKMWTDLRKKNKVDELLRVQMHFVHVTDPEKVQDVLREHASVVRNPGGVQPASVTSHRTPHNTSASWKKIYSSPDLFTETETDESVGVQDIEERDIEIVNFSKESRAGSARKRRESYDYVNTIQMLGLDEGEQDTKDPVTVQGAYLSFLHLRHLRLRDLRRTVLSVFNYFRSVERTLTINDSGLSLESGSSKRISAQNHRRNTEVDGSLGGGGSLGYHGYMHNTPADFKVNESEFMQFSDVDNHDDFYCLDEGRVHVQDQRGYFIVYDAAIADLEQMEKDLMLLSTHYIEKDREMRIVSRSKSSESTRRRSQVAGDFDILSYAHQDVDRFGVLLDMWSNEAAFMECKRELLDCYLEAYQHVFDRDEKRTLADIMTNIMHQRPRYDFKSNYFIKNYRAECVNLRLQANLVKNILDRQIDDQREYVQKVTRDGDNDFGLPYKIIPKQPISINLARSALKNVYMLEFHPSLAISGRIPAALKTCLKELTYIHKPDSLHDVLLMERRLIEIAIHEWEKMENIGISYSQQVQKDLFCDVFSEDPLFICEIAQTQVAQHEQQAQRTTQKERQAAMIEIVSRIMEALQLRYRLIDAAWETEILSKIYKKQAVEMGFDEYHMYMRMVQFEFANFNEKAGKPPPVFITAIQEDDSIVDRYTTASLYLAIHEIDESHVGRFSYRSREGILQILRTGGLESFQVVLKTQIAHKNMLICAVQQAHACQPMKEHIERKSGRASPTETKSEKSSLTQLTGMSSGTTGTGLGAKLQPDSGQPQRRSPEAFISIQLEKAPCRDLVLNDFINKKSQMGTVLRNAEEMEKLKRKMISLFCERYNSRIAQYSMRSQIIAYYNSILTLLDDFPNVRETYFVLGEANEKKSDTDSKEGLTPDPRVLKKRPRRVLSAEGQHVLNIWFIPHHSEILIMFKSLDDEVSLRALSNTLIIVSALHDMLQYLCAHSRLGSSHATLGSRRMEFVSADWGGTEGVGSELREIQKQLNNLPDPTSPEAVGSLLSLRRDVIFLEFETAVRHCVTETFLSTGNIKAYKSLANNLYHALPAVSNVQRPGSSSLYMAVPEPLEPRDFKAKELYPYRSFIGRNGPYQLSFWQFHQIGYYIQLCLSGLKDVDRHVANGEILGVTLLMEDVLQSGKQDHSVEQEESEKRDLNRPGSSSSKQTSSDLRIVPHHKCGLSRTHEPIESYKLLKSFLLLWKCMEIVKLDWGKRKLNTEKIESLSRFREYCKLYRAEKLFPVLQSVARHLGQGDMYEGLALDTDPIVMPKGASEIEIRAKQLFRLLESLECDMINEVRKKVAREFNLVLAERSREDSALPTDLWKRSVHLQSSRAQRVRGDIAQMLCFFRLLDWLRPSLPPPLSGIAQPLKNQYEHTIHAQVMKESFTISRPQMAENFIDKLMTDCRETETEVSFSKKHLNDCLSELARNIMAREKQNYESYTMYYENLLRVHHQLVYQREQEIKQVKDQLKSSQNNIQVEVQIQLADQAHDMLMEITALRAKIAEMREFSLTQERDIRERVKEEYDNLIQNLFNSAFQLKTKLDVFRDELHDDVYEKINEARREAMMAMSTVKQKHGGDPEEEQLKRNLATTDQLRSLQNENHQLNVLVMKMKAMTGWKENNSSTNFIKTIGDLRKQADNSKKEYLEVKMLAEEEVILLRQQLVAIRKALSTAEKECNEIKKQLEKEIKIKQEKEHEAIQKARGQKQLELAKQANVEKLVEELEDKDERLKMLSLEQDKSSKMQIITQDKIKKDVMTVKKQLSHERNMKLDAFQRVDELQAQIYDYENCLSRSPSAVTIPVTPSTSKPRSRATSATQRRSQPMSRCNSAITGIWPPPVSWPNRSLTPGGLHSNTADGQNEMLNNMDYKKMLRPKTTGGRLRSRIAEQLLNELAPDIHQTIIQLEQVQLDGKK